jgi:outer membrane lipoprotein carrier protein
LQWLYTKGENLKKIFYIFLFTIFVLKISFADVLKDIENIIHKSKSVKGEFIQISKIKDFDEKNEFKGILLISKPDKVKIKYTYPEENIIYVEKNKVIMYNLKDNQAVISNLSNQFIAVKIFNMIAKNQSFTELFNVNKKEENKKEIVIHLSPKKNEQIKTLKIIFSKKDYKIKKIEIVDIESNEIIIIFNKFKYLNKSLPLNFNLPSDTQVFYQ